MPFRYPGDGENEVATKLVEHGHPRLATAIVLARRVIWGIVIVLVIYGSQHAPDPATVLRAL